MRDERRKENLLYWQDEGIPIYTLISITNVDLYISTFTEQTTSDIRLDYTFLYSKSFVVSIATLHNQ